MQPGRRRLAAAGLAHEAERLAPRRRRRRRRRRRARRRPARWKQQPWRSGKCLTRSRTSTSVSPSVRCAARALVGRGRRSLLRPAHGLRSSSRHVGARLVGRLARPQLAQIAPAHVGGRAGSATRWPRIPADGHERRVDARVRLAHVGAARVEGAAGRRVDQRRRPARDRHERARRAVASAAGSSRAGPTCRGAGARRRSRRRRRPLDDPARVHDRRCRRPSRRRRRGRG